MKRKNSPAKRTRCKKRILSGETVQEEEEEEEELEDPFEEEVGRNSNYGESIYEDFDNDQ